MHQPAPLRLPVPSPVLSLMPSALTLLSTPPTRPEKGGRTVQQLVEASFEEGDAETASSLGSIDELLESIDMRGSGGERAQTPSPQAPHAAMSSWHRHMRGYGGERATTLG